MSEIDRIIDKINLALIDTGYCVCEFGKTSQKENICMGSFKTKIRIDNISLLLNRCVNIEKKGEQK